MKFYKLLYRLQKKSNTHVFILKISVYVWALHVLSAICSIYKPDPRSIAFLIIFLYTLFLEAFSDLALTQQDSVYCKQQCVLWHNTRGKIKSL